MALMVLSKQHEGDFHSMLKYWLMTFELISEYFLVSVTISKNQNQFKELWTPIPTFSSAYRSVATYQPSMMSLDHRAAVDVVVERR